ncbi:MAG: hypothetical protein ACFCBW_20845 [Candidatus Competibacterales bacterium]
MTSKSPNANAEATKAKAKDQRRAKREANVDAGLEALSLWLGDAMGAGLKTLRQQPPSQWAALRARLVDAQAPGLARRIDRVACAAQESGPWEAALLTELAQLHLLIQGYRRRQVFDPLFQADLDTFIGWSQTKAQAYGCPAVADRWQVVGCHILPERGGDLMCQRAWLWGHTQRRFAVVVEFAPAKEPQRLPDHWCAGRVFQGALHLFPSTVPLRAVAGTTWHWLPGAIPVPGFALGVSTVAQALVPYRRALAQLPWLERYPVALASVRMARDTQGWWVVDAEAEGLPLAVDEPGSLVLASLTGGMPVALFGEWQDTALTPLGVWAEGEWVDLVEVSSGMARL